MAESVSLLSSFSSSEEKLDEEKSQLNVRHKPRNVSSGWWFFLLGILSASLFGNIAQLTLWCQLRKAANSCKLPLAGLELDVDVDFGEKTVFGDVSNLEALDKAWFGMDVSGGVVALPYDRHLGSTDSFPWDTSKGLYVLNSFHSLHCLQSFYSFARSIDLNKPPTQTLEHVVHCLDVLRSEIMCVADDSPLSFRFQDLYDGEPPPKRKCRDWKQLEKYAEDNSACFRRYPPDDPKYDTFHEYMFCPRSSQYYDHVEKLVALNNSIP